MRITYRDGGDEQTVEVQSLATDHFRIRIGDEWLEARGGWRGDVLELHTDQGVLRALVSSRGARRFVSVHGVGEAILERVESARSSRSGGEDPSLASPMPGKVVKVLVKTGQKVRKGDTLLVVEAMKTEIRISAPRDGAVRQLHVGEGDRCDAGSPLVELE